MIIRILFIIFNLPQIIYSKIFEIKEKNGTLLMETMNGFQFEINYDFDRQISELNQIQISKCTENCKDCNRRQCYLGNTELDHSNIKMYDLDTQQIVLQHLTYFNDQNKNKPISKLSLAKLGQQYLNSFIDDGFQLCQGQIDITLETQFQIKMKDIPQQQVLLSPILSLNGLNHIKINYLKLGDTVVDISSCVIYFFIGKDQEYVNLFSNIDPDSQDYKNRHFSIKEYQNMNFLPIWIVNILSSEFSKAGFMPFQQDNVSFYFRKNINISTKLDSNLDFQFFNKDNEQNPIIYSQEKYIYEFQNGDKFIKICSFNSSQTIVLGKQFFENKKMQFNFEENFITIQNYYEDRCFKYEKSTLYQQEILVLQVSIPLIILLTLFFIKYQTNYNQNNGQRTEFQLDDQQKFQ